MVPACMRQRKEGLALFPLSLLVLLLVLLLPLKLTMLVPTTLPASRASVTYPPGLDSVPEGVSVSVSGVAGELVITTIMALQHVLALRICHALEGEEDSGSGRAGERQKETGTQEGHEWRWEVGKERRRVERTGRVGASHALQGARSVGYDEAVGMKRQCRVVTGTSLRHGLML